MSCLVVTDMLCLLRGASCIFDINFVFLSPTQYCWSHIQTQIAPSILKSETFNILPECLRWHFWGDSLVDILVRQCHETLNDICTGHTVGLYWVFGHAGVRRHMVGLYWVPGHAGARRHIVGLYWALDMLVYEIKSPTSSQEAVLL